MIIKNILIIIFFLIATHNYLYFFFFIFIFFLIFWKIKFIKKEKEHHFLKDVLSLFAKYNKEVNKEEALNKVNEEMLHLNEDIIDNLKKNYDSYFITLFCECLFLDEKEDISSSISYMIDNDIFYENIDRTSKGLNELVFSSLLVFICSFCFTSFLANFFSSSYGLIVFLLLGIYQVILVLFLFNITKIKSIEKIKYTFQILKINSSSTEALNMIFIMFPYCNKNKHVQNYISNLLLKDNKKKVNESIIELIPSFINLMIAILMIGVF